MEFARWQFVGLMTPTETQGTMTNANVRTKFQAFESRSFRFARVQLGSKTCVENDGTSSASPCDLRSRYPRRTLARLLEIVRHDARAITATLERLLSRPHQIPNDEGGMK